MKYEGRYSDLEEPIKSKSLQEVQQKIEKLGEYNPKDKDSIFVEYYTAWIMEYNFIGRQTAQHYFSMLDRKWHRSPNRLTMYHSWNRAIEPIKTIVQWFLRVFGYRKQEQMKTSEWIQQNKINELYPQKEN